MHERCVVSLLGEGFDQTKVSHVKFLVVILRDKENTAGRDLIDQIQGYPGTEEVWGPKPHESAAMHLARVFAERNELRILLKESNGRRLSGLARYQHIYGLTHTSTNST